MTQLQTALAMGEEIVDRNPTACLTREFGVKIDTLLGGKSPVEILKDKMTERSMVYSRARDGRGCVDAA